MNKVSKNIIENIIVPHSNTTLPLLNGEIINIDMTRNRANILVNSTGNKGAFVIEKVPLTVPSVGINPHRYTIGDKVLVMFENNSPLCPKIIGSCDERYEVNTREKLKHLEQGALRVDIIKNDYKSTIASSDRWLNTNEDTSYKHLQNINFNVEDYIKNLARNLGYYGDKDVGITNPTSKSTVILRENGCIDIYTDNCHGISVNPNNYEITINSNKEFIINSEKVSLNCNSLKINGKEQIKEG